MLWEDIKVFTGTNPDVAKFVFIKDDAIAEAVLYKYGSYEQRTVICCSVQSGCEVGCYFCGTGKVFVRNLTSNEIMSQVNHLINYSDVNVKKCKKLQIMFMSMGEPLLNLDNVCTVVEILNARYPNADLLISTVAPKVDMDKIFDLSERIDKVGLQFSIHETEDSKRNKIIPYNNLYSLNEIKIIGERWEQKTGRKPFLNYCVHSKNSGQKEANDLFNKFPPNIWNVTLSVICEKNSCNQFNPSQLRNINIFYNILLSQSYNVRIFNPQGQDDIGAGCGQLWYVQEWLKTYKELN